MGVEASSDMQRNLGFVEEAQLLGPHLLPEFFLAFAVKSVSCN